MGRSLQFLGARDQKRQFENSVGFQAPILHLSTHAVADYERPEVSRLLFSPAEGSNAPDYVFLKGVYGLDLHGIDLAVLSACDTERGVIIPGEGLQGFSRAFLAAGARSTITTLWRVDDQATAEFMKQFYYFLVRKRQSKGEALRLAKLKFINSGTRYAEPRYWAAFVLSGDASRLQQQFVSWSSLLIGGTILLLILSVIVFALLRSRLLKTDRNRGDNSGRVVSEQPEHLHRG
jgi:CHAT domain-containing protein